MAPNRVTVNGKVCNIALALARGILNRAVRNNKVAHRSITLRKKTNGQSFLFMDCLKLFLTKQKIKIKIVTKIPRMKIVCETGRSLAQYLIMVSLEI